MYRENNPNFKKNPFQEITEEEIKNISAREENFLKEVSKKQLKEQLKELPKENIDFYKLLFIFEENILKNCIEEKSNENSINNDDNKQCKIQKLDLIFRPLFDFYKKCNNSFAEYPPEIFVDEHIYDAIVFTTLALFIHTTKRIRGKTLADFTYQYSTLNHSDQTIRGYKPPNKNSNSLGDASGFRKARNRILKNRNCYYKYTEWNSMPLDSEREWSLYYAWDGLLKKQYPDEDLSILQDTYKRIGNLYNDIEKQLASAKDDKFPKRLESAYSRFLNKVTKIKYENYLELQKKILTYIREDKTYYGMNIYRLEKLLKPYILTTEVNNLLKCPNPDVEHSFLRQTFILKDLFYPRLYEDFFKLPNDIANYYCFQFNILLNHITWAGRLILEGLIEKGYFGTSKEWSAFFCNEINKMTERVFYSIDEIDYTVIPESQVAFMKLLSMPVEIILRANGYNPLDQN